MQKRIIAVSFRISFTCLAKTAREYFLHFVLQKQNSFKEITENHIVTTTMKLTPKVNLEYKHLTNISTHEIMKWCMLPNNSFNSMLTGSILGTRCAFKI